jgi:hypothetical protein
MKEQQRELYDMGRALGELGWTLLPIAPNSKRPWAEMVARTHGSRSWKAIKEPVSDVALRTWMDESPDVGLGVRCGGVSGGLVCVDFDEGLPDVIPNTPVETSGRGGHAYFHLDAESGGRDHATGQVLADNQLVVIAPSPYYLGGRYEWIRSPLEFPLAPLPQSFAALLDQAPRSSKSAPRVSGGRASAPSRPEIRAVATRHRMYFSNRPAKGGAIDRSEYEFGMAKDLLRAGASPDEVLTCFLDWWPVRHGEAFQQRGNIEWTRHTIHKAELSLANEPCGSPQPPNHVEDDSDITRYGRVDELEFLRMVRGQRAGELVEEAQAVFNVSRSTAAQNKALAQHMGYITVIGDPGDGRVKRVSLTAKGQALVAANAVRFPRGRAPHELRTYRREARAERAVGHDDVGSL